MEKLLVFFNNVKSSVFYNWKKLLYISKGLPIQRMYVRLKKLSIHSNNSTYKSILNKSHWDELKIIK